MGYYSLVLRSASYFDSRSVHFNINSPPPPPHPSPPLAFCVQVYGTSAGGDADELRLLSTAEGFINLRAHGGSLDFMGTKVKRLIGALIISLSTYTPLHVYVCVWFRCTSTNATAAAVVPL